MPCYTTTRIEVTENAGNWNAQRWANLQYLDSDLSRVQLVDGKLTVRAASTEEGAKLIAKARQAYAAQTIKDAAKRFGWRVAAETKTTSGQAQIKLAR